MHPQKRGYKFALALKLSSTHGEVRSPDLSVRHGVPENARLVVAASEELQLCRVARQGPHLLAVALHNRLHGEGEAARQDAVPSGAEHEA